MPSNDEGKTVAKGTVAENDGSARFYCGLRREIPGTDGRCGPTDGNNCRSCARFTNNVVSTNDEGKTVAKGTVVEFDGSAIFYCGLRREIPGTDGRCGPTNGNNCRSCARFTNNVVPTNDEGKTVAKGTVAENDGSARFYCGLRREIPGTDGRCGPTDGNNCCSCARFTKDILVPTLNPTP